MPFAVVVLLFAALPAIGNFAGGLLAEFLPLSHLMLNLTLYTAAGVVVDVELMPRALEAKPAWAFVLGGVFYVVVDWAIQRLNDRYGGEGGSVGGLLWRLTAKFMMVDPRPHTRNGRTSPECPPP